MFSSIVDGGDLVSQDCKKEQLFSDKNVRPNSQLIKISEAGFNILCTICTTSIEEVVSSVIPNTVYTCIMVFGDTP